LCAIWRDADFQALRVDAQHLYLLLISQADMSAAGTLHLSVTRWTSRTAGRSMAEVRKELGVLADKGFIAFDENTEELAVRSFIKWDQGYSNPKRRPAIRDAFEAIESDIVRAVVAHELARLFVDKADLYKYFKLDPESVHGEPPVSADNSERVQRQQSVSAAIDSYGMQRDSPRMHRDQRVSAAPTLDAVDDHEYSQGNTVSGTQSDTVADTPGLVVEILGIGLDPETANRSPLRGEQRDDPFDEFWTVFPRRHGKIPAKAAWVKALKAGHKPKDIIDGAIRYAEYRRTDPEPKTKEERIQKTKMPGGWLKDQRWLDEIPGLETTPPTQTVPRCPEHDHRPINNCQECDEDHGDPAWHTRSHT